MPPGRWVYPESPWEASQKRLWSFWRRPKPPWTLLEALRALSEAFLDPPGGLPSLANTFLKPFQGFLKGHLDLPRGFQGLPKAILGLS